MKCPVPADAAVFERESGLGVADDPALDKPVESIMNPHRTSSDTPTYPGATVSARIATALAAITMSSTLIGGMLGLFEMHSEDAMIAKAQDADRGVVMVATESTWFADESAAGSESNAAH